MAKKSNKDTKKVLKLRKLNPQVLSDIVGGADGPGGTEPPAAYGTWYGPAYNGF